MKNVFILLSLFFLAMNMLSVHAQDATDVLMIVSGKPVYVRDFLQAYEKNSVKDMDSFLKLYKEERIKLAYASQQGLDTLDNVCQQQDYFVQYLHNNESLPIESLAAGSLSGLSLYIGHLVLPLPQHLPYAGYQYELKNRMDSIYTQIQNGQDFMTIANQISPYTRNEFWISKNHMLAEVENVAYRLENDEISAPFLATDGYHMVKLLKKHDFSISQIEEATSAVLPLPIDDCLLEEYREGLILNELYKFEKPVVHAATEEELQAWYTDHKKDYSWDIPHFRGVVYQCKDKKTQKKVAKLLKKIPDTQWKSLFESDRYASLFSQVKMSELKTYKLSEDRWVDELAFGGPKVTRDAGYPFVGLAGRKLKKGPDSYLDVREQLLADIHVGQQKMWVEDLEKQIPVWLNKKVFEKLKKYNQ